MLKFDWCLRACSPEIKAKFKGSCKPYAVLACVVNAWAREKY